MEKYPGGTIKYSESGDELVLTIEIDFPWGKRAHDFYVTRTTADFGMWPEMLMLVSRMFAKWSKEKEAV